jgi:hypothetical protein
MAEVPISMVLLSRVLNYRINRWANIFAGTITIAMIINNGVKDLDDVFFTAIEVVALALIVWCAWKWRRQKALDNPVFDSKPLNY